MTHADLDGMPITRPPVREPDPYRSTETRRGSMDSLAVEYGLDRPLLARESYKVRTP